MSNHPRTQAGNDRWWNELLLLQPELQGDCRDTAPPGTQGPEEGGMAGEGRLVHTNLLLGALPGPPSFILEQEWGSCGDLAAAIVPVEKTLFGQ